jgi:ferredoxin
MNHSSAESGPPLTVVIAPFGWQFTSDGSHSLMESARQAGFILPSSCRNGSCRMCLCQLRSGQIRYLIDWPGVSADEKKEGLILPCVATAQSALNIFVPGAIDERAKKSAPYTKGALKLMPGKA